MDPLNCWVLNEPSALENSSTDAKQLHLLRLNFKFQWPMQLSDWYIFIKKLKRYAKPNSTHKLRVVWNALSSRAVEPVRKFQAQALGI